MSNTAKTYRIEFLNADNQPMADCRFQIMQFDMVLAEGRADGNGRATVRADLIANKTIWLRFWGKGQTQDSAFASANFKWQEGIVTQPVRTPVVYDVPLRDTENKSHEPAEYRQAFYEVQAGDTWESIAAKCETDADLIRYINNLPVDDTPPEVGDALLLPKGAKRPPAQDSSTANPSSTDNDVVESHRYDKMDDVLAQVNKEKEQKSQPPVNPEKTPATIPDSSKKTDDSASNKPKTDPMRSSENQKPMEKARGHKHTEECTNNFHKISNIILKHEGGIVDDPSDSGGLTNMGIAWKTWIAYAKIDLGVEPTRQNLIHLRKDQAEIIYRKRYWEPRGFCQLQHLKVALMIYDWSITSGGAIPTVKTMITSFYNIPLKQNSKMDQEMIDVINSIPDQTKLLNRIADRRKKYYSDLAARVPKNKKFLNGWINRVNSCLGVIL